MILSKRPGRLIAGSKASSMLVAPITTTLSLLLKPSISARIWLMVSLQWLGSIGRRVPASESISSMKIIEGACIMVNVKSWYLERSDPKGHGVICIFRCENILMVF